MSTTKKVSIHKSKLAKVMAEPRTKEKEKYRPTVDECSRWFRIINKEVFENQLDTPEEIRVASRGIPKRWGECWGYKVEENDQVVEKTYIINMNPWFKSKQHFLEVLTHEMTHSYQWLFHDCIDHGETFQEWKPIVARFNINDFM